MGAREIGADFVDRTELRARRRERKSLEQTRGQIRWCVHARAAAPRRTHPIDPHRKLKREHLVEGKCEMRGAVGSLELRRLCVGGRLMKYAQGFAERHHPGFSAQRSR